MNSLEALHWRPHHALSWIVAIVLCSCIAAISYFVPPGFINYYFNRFPDDLAWLLSTRIGKAFIIVLRLFPRRCHFSLPAHIGHAVAAVSVTQHLALDIC